MSAIEAAYRAHAPAALATLIRLLADFDLAEEALAEAFQAASVQWPRDGAPANPRAWLISTGRFKAIDRLRKRARFNAALGDIADALAIDEREDDLADGPMFEDDRLRLIFTCCHPALAPDAQTALALRTVCGLTTEEIARAFLVPAPTLAQRIVRAKAKIREARIPYETPGPHDLPARLDGVLQVIYLVFNEGYSASAGEDVARADLCAAAIEMARGLVEMLPEAEAVGLLALMVLQDSRRAARADANGDVILLADQDRSLWDRAKILEGVRLTHAALAAPQVGRFTLQAAIAAAHGIAPRAADTDWSAIVSYYDLLLRADPSPVVELNRAAALAMCDGPQAGLDVIDAILARGDLRDYHYAHSARGELLLRLGRKADAAQAYERALALAQQGPERRFLAARLARARS